MSLDLSTFNPSSVGDLAKALEGEVTSMAGKDWTEQSGEVKAYLKTLAQAATDTATSLAEGKMPEAEAKAILEMQKTALENTAKFSGFMAMADAQNIIDRLMNVVTAVIKNKTGISISL